jgi:hypothetical protein
MSYAQAIEMQSGHPDSDRFIEEYRRLSATHPETIDALTLTGETFYREHRRGSLPGSGQPRTPCGSREVSSNRGFTRFAVRVRGVALMRGRRAFSHHSPRRPLEGNIHGPDTPIDHPHKLAGQVGVPPSVRAQ